MTICFLKEVYGVHYVEISVFELISNNTVRTNNECHQLGAALVM